jgi:dihydrofolate reductase
MNLIVAVDKNWAIGKNGKELVNIPEDKKFFREETYGKVIVMGRKTFESLPGSAALEGRKNIVLTENKSYNPKNATVCHSIDELKEILKDYASEDIYVIGGGSIYGQLLDMCDTAQVTKVDYTYDADTYFPNLDEKAEWHIDKRSDERTYFDMIYEFVRYVRK